MTIWLRYFLVFSVVAVAATESNATGSLDYCAERSGFPAGQNNQCFDTYAAAEAFLRAEPTPPVGNSLLQQTISLSLPFGGTQTFYSVPDRDVGSLYSDWYWALFFDLQARCEDSSGHWPQPGPSWCESESNLYDVIVDEDEGPFVAGEYIGSYDNFPPQQWSAVPPGTVSHGDLAGESISFAWVDRTVADVPGQREFRAYYADGTPFDWDVNRADFYPCPALFSAYLPGPNTVWPRICKNTRTGHLTVRTAAVQQNSCPQGNPCIPATGAKEQSETDFAWEGMSFSRYYSSLGTLALNSGMGAFWAHQFSDRLGITSHVANDISWVDSNAHMDILRYVSGTSHQYYSLKNSGTLLVRQPAGASEAFTLITRSGQELGFDLDGRLVRKQVGDSEYQLHYCSNTLFQAGSCDSLNELHRVTSKSGRPLEFRYASVAIPSGTSGVTTQVWRITSIESEGVILATYDYDTEGRLERVHHGDAVGSTFREYRYGEPSHLCLLADGSTESGCDPNALSSGTHRYTLTGIIDESGQRYGDYTYDSQGRVTASYHDAGAGKVGLTYLDNGLVDVTQPEGGTRRFVFSTPLFKVMSSVEELTTDGSVGGTTLYTYDGQNYRRNSKVDARGVKTTFAYNTRGLETLRTEDVPVPGPATPSCPLGGNYYAQNYGTGCQSGTCWSSPNPHAGSQSGAPFGWNGWYYSCAIVSQPSAGTEQRLTRTEWHPTFPQFTRRTRELPNGEVLSLTTREISAENRVTAHCEHDVANPAASTYICGSATNAPVGVRQTRWSYCTAADVSSGTCAVVDVVKSVDGPRTDISDVTTYQYHLNDAANCAGGGACDYRKGDLKRVINAANQQTNYLRYDGGGRALVIADANQVQTHMTYHPRGWLTSRRSCAPGTPSYPCSGLSVSQMTIAYTPWGGVDKVTQADGSYLDYGYDPAHRLISITDNQGNSIVYTLDAAGNRTDEHTYDPFSQLKRALGRQFDQLGRLHKVLNVVNMQVVETEYSYDANGNRETSTDALSVVTDSDYDPLNRLIKTIQDYGTDPGDINVEIEYDYDARDNLIKVTDPKGLETEYVYDGLNDQVTLISPDTGTTTYEYDSAGNRSAQVDARGVRTEYDYDELNRLTGIRYPADSSKDVGFIYDQLFGNECPAPADSASVGRLSRFTDHSGQTTLCYDHRGNVIRKVQLTAGEELVTAWTYDLANRVTGITYPSGKSVTIGRDTLGRVSSISVNGATLPGGGTTLVSSVSYEPFGPVKQISYGDGFSQTRSYDQNYWISQIDSSRATGLDAFFEQDAVGNIVKLSAQAIGSGGGNGADRTIGYDDLYRLTEVRKRNSALIEGYSYDDTGNRLNKSADTQFGSVDPYLGAYSYPSDSHRLEAIDGIERRYDEVGNLTGIITGRAHPGFLYDERNRMTSYTFNGLITKKFDYNGRGERVWRGEDGPAKLNQLFVYDESGRLLGEYDGLGNSISEVIWLDDLPVGVIRGADLYPIESDHLGSPRVVAEGANAVWRWDLMGAAFGNTAPNQDPDGNGKLFQFDLRFPGQQWDAASGLHYNYFRDYESGAGRYVESDPIGLAGGIGTFAYASSSPVRIFDSSGLFGMFAHQTYNGAWRFRFQFRWACRFGASPIDHADNLFQRFPVVGRIRRAQTEAEQKPTGDTDAVNMCACRQFDSDLQELFDSRGWGTGDAYGGRSYSEAEATEMLNELRRRTNQLNAGLEEECDKCSLPWDSLLEIAKERGVPYIGNGISR